MTAPISGRRPIIAAMAGLSPPYARPTPAPRPPYPSTIFEVRFVSGIHRYTSSEQAMQAATYQ